LDFRLTIGNSQRIGQNEGPGKFANCLERFGNFLREPENWAILLWPKKLNQPGIFPKLGQNLFQFGTKTFRIQLGAGILLPRVLNFPPKFSAGKEFYLVRF